MFDFGISLFILIIISLYFDFSHVYLVLDSVRSRSHTFYLKAPNLMLARTLTERVVYNRELDQTPTHTPPGGARPTLSAQCGPICTWTPSYPPLPLALITPTAGFFCFWIRLEKKKFSS